MKEDAKILGLTFTSITSKSREAFVTTYEEEAIHQENPIA